MPANTAIMSPAVAERVPLVSLFIRDADADECGYRRGYVAEGVESVRDQRDRAGKKAADELEDEERGIREYVYDGSPEGYRVHVEHQIGSLIGDRA